MPHLYKYNGKNIDGKDFSQALVSLGVKPGDTIFVHSDITPFGKLDLQDREAFFSALVSIFTSAVGPAGTVIMPTFSYSYCNNQEFDVLHTKSTVGALTDFFRTQPGVTRTRHPIYSVAVWGARKDEILNSLMTDSFGSGTVFDVAHRLNAKFILFGVSIEVCTFLHHVEQMHKVPYRFMKTFHGTTVMEDGHRIESDVTYFVRPLDGTVENDMSRIESKLYECRVLKETTVGGGMIRLITAADLFNVTMSALDADSRFLLTQP